MITTKMRQQMVQPGHRPYAIGTPLAAVHGLGDHTICAPRPESKGRMTLIPTAGPTMSASVLPERSIEVCAMLQVGYLGGDCRREPQCILLALDKDLLTIRGTDVLGGV
jgi:hypothetical protein